MSFMIEDDRAFLKYNEIWKKIKNTFNIKFNSMPVYDEKDIKTKVKDSTSKFIGHISWNNSHHHLKYK